MPPSTYKSGPGTLTLNDGTAFTATAQVTNCRVSPSENVESEDDIPVLSGETVVGEDNVTFDYVLEGTFLQDTLATGGLVDFTWTNAGEQVTFEFVPKTGGRGIQGTVSIVPLAVGGEVKQRATSDFSWRVIGTPTFYMPV